MKTKNDFIDRLDKKFIQISSQPKSCPQSLEIKGLRKSVLDKRTSFFYRINSNSIEVLTIFDNSQSPENIQQSVK